MEAAGVDAVLRGDLELGPRRQQGASKRAGEDRGGDERVVRRLAEPQVPPAKRARRDDGEDRPGRPEHREAEHGSCGPAAPRRPGRPRAPRSSPVAPRRRRRRRGCRSRRASGAAPRPASAGPGGTRAGGGRRGCRAPSGRAATGSRRGREAPAPGRGSRRGSGSVQPAAVHLDRRVEVLGDRLSGHPAHLDECCAAQKRGRTAPEHAVVAVLARADHLEEHALLVAARLVVLHRVLVVEVVRALDEGDLVVVEIAHGGVEGVGERVRGQRPGRRSAHRSYMPSAWLILPAFAWELSGRHIQCAPHSSARASISGRRPSSRRKVSCGYRRAAHPASVASTTSDGLVVGRRRRRRRDSRAWPRAVGLRPAPAVKSRGARGKEVVQLDHPEG